MMSENNGSPLTCARNLMRTIRGEVPYSRIKGLSREHIDSPVTRETNELEVDASWTLGVYEPRLNAEEIDLIAANAPDGDFALRIDAEERREI